MRDLPVSGLPFAHWTNKDCRFLVGVECGLHAGIVQSLVWW